MSAKELARGAGVPKRTMYRVLARLRSFGVIEPTPAGFALSSVLGDITTDPAAILGFENARWTVRKWRTDPPPPCRVTLHWTAVDGGTAGSFETVNLAWEGRTVTLRYYPSAETLEVVIEARVPIPLLAAPVLQGWLVAMLGLGRGEESECTHIEVNATHEHFRADGYKYLEIRRLGEWAQIFYQKAAGLKHEIRLYRPTDADGERMSVERSLEVLVEGSPVRTLLKIVERELQLEMARHAPEGTAQPRRDPTGLTPGEARESGYG